LLIGADGNDSSVGRILRGAPWPEAKRGLAIRGYFENVVGATNEACMYFAEGSFPGYSWIFPIDKYRANVGVGVVLDAKPPAEPPKTLLARFIDSDAGMRSRLESAVLKGDAEVCLLNLYDAQLPLAGTRVMLVGEAAGLVNPFNGEGVQFALLSGRWASEVTASGLASGDFSEHALSGYPKRIEEELGYGFKVSDLILQLIRNRNLNPVWLQALEIMAAKSKTDPEYARLTSGILSGMIFPNQETFTKIIVGALKETAITTGMTIVTDALNNPATLPTNALKIAQTGLEIAVDAAQDPFTFLQWGIGTAFKMAQLAAELPKQMLKENESQTENQ
jgi:menaquinone-9 beta-reductase